MSSDTGKADFSIRWKGKHFQSNFSRKDHWNRKFFLLALKKQESPLNFLNFDLKKLLSILFILALPFVSINMQQNPLSQGWYDRPFGLIAAFTQSLFFSFSDGVRGTTTMYLNLINIKKDNFELKNQNQSLLTRLEAMNELQRENDRLNLLLDFKAHTKMELIAARVMSKDLVSDHNTLLLNKGTHHGLKAGQAVITVGGVVGYIFKPGTMTSQVLLITDRYSVVDGMIARSRARGIVEGKNSTSCSLRYVEKSEDVVPGDLVISSGLDNIFPKGFPVAIVESVENKSYSVSLKVDLKPVVDPDKVEEVFIVLNAANEDLSDRLSVGN
ncbi:MAG: rod shape-determining protein MreC [Bdellovibrio sp. CG10_big_fil_rev_8_21_14_0_10_47_8]|nr:MAG: rod shape-determining protein MreC [Bdellovibrio sp. CG10_big_fil_rev_8_21_14_0_10_47_8]